MQHKVRFSPEADDQLRLLGLYIAEKKSESVALRYITAIIKTCYALEFMPDRGTRRDDLLGGMRTFGFKRRVTICFRVSTATVDIIAVLYGGQDLGKYFQSNVIR